MAITNYYTVGGSIIGEQTAGTQRIDYITDALGSVTATVDQTGAVQNIYRYKPYGDQLARTGTEPDPKFTWVGSLGYRQTGEMFASVYIRARTYAAALGKWTSIDPANSELNTYLYAKASPIFISDRSGLDCNASTPPGDLSGAEGSICQFMKDAVVKVITANLLSGCTCSAEFVGIVVLNIKRACASVKCTADGKPIPTGMLPLSWISNVKVKCDNTYKLS